MRTLLLFLGLSLLASCYSGQQTSDGGGLARFVSDPVFCAQHEIPEPLEYEGKGTIVRFATPDGKEGSAYVLYPEKPSTSVLLVFHEWWGLNDYVRKECDRLAEELECEVWAIDLYDGQVASDRETAGKLMQQAEPERLKNIISGAMAFVGPEKRIGTLGWCFGGGWSLEASILAGPQGKACVLYYGMPVETEDELLPLQAPVLGIFAENDGWIKREMIVAFEERCLAMGKDFTWEMYEAEHAFANPSSPRYHHESAQSANKKALTFLKRHLLE